MEYKLSKNQKKIWVVREVKENIYDFTGIKVNSVYKGTVRSMYVQHQMERHCILPVKRKAMRVSEILLQKIIRESSCMIMIGPSIIMELIIRNVLPMYCGT